MNNVAIAELGATRDVRSQIKPGLSAGYQRLAGHGFSGASSGVPPFRISRFHQGLRQSAVHILFKMKEAIFRFHNDSGCERFDVMNPEPRLWGFSYLVEYNRIV